MTTANEITVSDNLIEAMERLIAYMSRDEQHHYIECQYLWADLDTNRDHVYWSLTEMAKAIGYEIPNYWRDANEMEADGHRAE